MTRQVIGFHYKLTDAKGEQIDSSEGQEPLFFLEGSGQIIPGLESEIKDLSVGEKKTVVVAPSDAYGETVNDLVMTVKRTQFPEDATLTIGDRFKVNEDPNAPIFTITGLNDEEVTIDGNHPLAGVELHFDVEITHKREAKEEEIEHGHAHGADGSHTH